MADDMEEAAENEDLDTFVGEPFKRPVCCVCGKEIRRASFFADGNGYRHLACVVRGSFLVQIMRAPGLAGETHYYGRLWDRRPKHGRGKQDVA